MDPIDEVLRRMRKAWPALTKPALVELQSRLARQLTFLGKLQVIIFPEPEAEAAATTVNGHAASKGIQPAIAAAPPAPPIETNGHALPPNPDEVVGCLCGCGKRAHARGLAAGCLEQARARVNAGLTTWEQLVSAGQALPDRGWRRQRDIARTAAIAATPPEINGHANGHAYADFVAAWNAAGSLEEVAGQFSLDKRGARNRAAHLRRRGVELKRFPRRGDEGWQEPARPAKPMAPCLECDKPVKTRGLCVAHYQRAKVRVREGKASWNELIAAGAALPARQGAAPRRSTTTHSPGNLLPAAKRPSSAEVGDQVRRSLAGYLLQHGKASVGTLSEVAELRWDEIHKITKHPWFDRQADGIHLTHEGRQALGGQPDDD